MNNFTGSVLAPCSDWGGSALGRALNASCGLSENKLPLFIDIVVRILLTIVLSGKIFIVVLMVGVAHHKASSSAIHMAHVSALLWTVLLLRHQLMIVAELLRSISSYCLLHLMLIHGITWVYIVLIIDISTRLLLLLIVLLLLARVRAVVGMMHAWLLLLLMVVVRCVIIGLDPV